MKNFKVDLSLLGLALLTFLLWYLKIETLHGILIYLGIFAFLFWKKKPVSHYVAVIVFSVMSDSYKGYFMTDYILLLVVLGGIIIKCIKEKRVTLGGLFYILVLYFIYNGLSIIWTPIKSDGYHTLKSMLEGYLVYFVLTNGGFKLKDTDRKSISKLATFFMLTLTFELLSVYLTNGFEETLMRKTLLDLGWNFSNLIAVVFTFGLPIGLYKYLDDETYHPVYFILDMLNVVGLILTLSRGAMVGAFVGIVLYFFLTLKKKYIFRYYTLALGLGVMALYFFYPQISSITDKFMTKNFFDDSNRYPLYELGIKSFLDSPIVGHGIKSSRYLIRTVIKGSNNYFHNYIIQIAGTLGGVGLMLQGMLHVKWFKLFFKKEDAFILCAGFAIVSSLTHQLLDISYDRLFFGVFMYSIIGVVEVYRHQNADDPWKMKVIEKE